MKNLESLSRVWTIVAIVLASVLLLVMLLQLMSLDVEHHERDWLDQGWRHGDSLSEKLSEGD